MITRRHLLLASAAAWAVPFVGENAVGQAAIARATVLFDAFGQPSNLKRGWGYSVFVEYAGRRILFDTGGNRSDFVSNATALGIDLSKLDFVALSHRHNDHTAGLNHVLSVNPAVTIYTPIEAAQFDTPIPAPLMGLIRRKVEDVPEDLRYYGGAPPTQAHPDSPWPAAHFSHITEPKEVLPGFFLFSTRSERPGTVEMNEISLIIKTPKGGILIVGCSHPGIEKIVEAATRIEPRIYTVLGGFHLVDYSDEEVIAMVARFRDKWHIERMAAGHCTGQFGFAELARVFGGRFDHAGVGSVISLPT